MSENIDYAEMLEIPVNTLNVTKKRSRKKKEADSDLKERVVERVNERVTRGEREEPAAFSAADMPEEGMAQGENVVDYGEEAQVFESAPHKPKKFLENKLLLAEFIAVCALCATILLTNLFWQESAIKHKTPLDGFRKDLPALGALDKVNAMATLVGFPCYTLGVLCGLLWARISWGSFMSGDFKEWISFVILALYALLFHQRQALGWRGRKPAILALVIFAASLFSMFVVNTVLSTQHGF